MDKYNLVLEVFMDGKAFVQYEFMGTQENAVEVKNCWREKSIIKDYIEDIVIRPEPYNTHYLQHCITITFKERKI
jgi:hypothetical protein